MTALLGHDVSRQALTLLKRRGGCLLTGNRVVLGQERKPLHRGVVRGLGESCGPFALEEEEGPRPVSKQLPCPAPNGDAGAQPGVPSFTLKRRSARR